MVNEDTTNTQLSLQENTHAPSNFSGNKQKPRMQPKLQTTGDEMETSDIQQFVSNRYEIQGRLDFFFVDL